MQTNPIDTAELKARVTLSEIVGRRVVLKQRGREMEGLCPFHDERTPSFGVNDDKGSYHCFGCGANGDVIRFVQLTEGLDFLGAVQQLQGGDWPAVDPAIRQRAVARDSAERLAKIADAQSLWRSALPATGTLAETYARSRGIACPLPRSVRFARTWAWKDYATGETGPDIPAMIGAVQDVAGNLVGVQRIFLSDNGMGKAAMPAPKRSLGQIQHCALRLGPPAREIIVCEGPEDGLTLAQMLPGVSVWVALGTSLMPTLELPAIVESVTLAGDNNAPGRAAIESAAKAIVATCRTVRTMFPEPAFVDFNDQMQGLTR